MLSKCSPTICFIADMKTPKMQLDVQPIKDIWSGEDKSKDGEGGPLTSSSSQPIHAFHSQLWSVRMAASRCYESFYIVEELDQLLKYHQHLLNTKAHAFHMHMSSFAMAAARSNVPPQQHEIHVQQQRMQFEKEQLMINHIIGEISKERDNAITVLALSCGITPAEDNTNTGNTGLKVDEELFSALISTIKGKKLIISMFGYLLPAHKWAILPLVLIKILQRIETSNALNTSVDLEIEMRLLNQYVDVSCQWIPHNGVYTCVLLSIIFH